VTYPTGNSGFPFHHLRHVVAREAGVSQARKMSQEVLTRRADAEVLGFAIQDANAYCVALGSSQEA